MTSTIVANLARGINRSDADSATWKKESPPQRGFSEWSQEKRHI